jgi:uroporphyrin-III C-methyltransferase
VIYMGVSGAERIQHELLQGLPGPTPVAIVQHASLPGQRQALCTLAGLCDCLRREGLGSPR